MLSFFYTDLQGDEKKKKKDRQTASSSYLHVLILVRINVAVLDGADPQVRHGVAGARREVRHQEMSSFNKLHRYPRALQHRVWEHHRASIKACVTIHNSAPCLPCHQNKTCTVPGVRVRTQHEFFFLDDNSNKHGTYRTTAKPREHTSRAQLQ